MKKASHLKSWIITSLLFALLAGPGCAKKDPAQAAAEQEATDAALAWVALIDKGSYAESWEQSASPFRNASTAESWGTMAKPVREPLGAVKSREVADRNFTTSLPNAAAGEYVVIQFKTDFENKKGAIETVTPMKEDGKWKVSGYYIR